MLTAVYTFQKKLSLVSAIVLLSLSGCGDKPEVDLPKPAKLEAKTDSELSGPSTGQSDINERLDISLNAELSRLSPEAKKAKAKYFVEQAIKAREAHDFETAVQNASIAISLDSALAQAYLERARALHHSTFGDDKQALKDAKVAVKLDPAQVKAWEYLGRLYDIQKDYIKAVEAYDYAISKDPVDRDLRNLRASALRILGRHREALKDYTALVELVPEKTDPYLQRGAVYEFLEENEKALADYSKGAENSKGDMKYGGTMPFRIRAKLYIKMNEPEKAIKDLTAVIERDVSDEESLRLRGLQYEKLDQNDKALADFSKSISLAPNLARASYEARARLYKEMGKSDLAEADLAKARKIKSKPAEVPIYQIKTDD